MRLKVKFLKEPYCKTIPHLDGTFLEYQAEDCSLKYKNIKKKIPT